MASRVISSRGKSLALSAAANKRSAIRIPLLPTGPVKSLPLAMRQPRPLHQALLSLSTKQSRSFSTLQRLRDVILQRPNPVLLALPAQDQYDTPTDEEELHRVAFAERKPIRDLPNFSLMEPYHFKPVARQMQVEYEAALEEFENKLEASEGQLSYHEVVTELDLVEAPLRVLGNICTLLRHLHEDVVSQIALDAALQQLDDRHKTSQSIVKALRQIEKSLMAAPEENESTRRHLWAVRFLLSRYDNIGMNLEDVKDREAMESIMSVIGETEGKFSKKRDSMSNKPYTTREKLEDVYYILSLRAEQAKRLGFESYTEMAFQSDSRMASNVDEVRSLHDQVVSRVLPVASSASSAALEQEVDLRPYLTLDGVLGGAFGLSRALFGVVVSEETDKNQVNGWYPDVRLFHVFDEDHSGYLGSFYLDPYRRQVKTSQPFVGSIFEKSGNILMPLVCLNCNITPPVWDHMPTEVTLDDAQSLFHEFGHVLQYMLAQDSTGGVFSPQNMQLDAEEVLSQFMEHWLFQESVLQSLAQLSQSDEAIPKEIVEKVLQQRSHQKAHEIMHRVFLSELEFDLLSGLGDESIVAILRNLSEKFKPHDPLHRSDISPLVELFADNVRGERVVRYRYLWSEVMSADIFAVFEEAGLANEAEIKRLGRQLRELFLSPGASVDTREAFKKFRGRDMSVTALMEMYGF